MTTASVATKTVFSNYQGLRENNAPLVFSAEYPENEFRRILGNIETLVGVSTDHVSTWGEISEAVEFAGFDVEIILGMVNKTIRGYLIEALEDRIAQERSEPHQSNP